MFPCNNTNCNGVVFDASQVYCDVCQAPQFPQTKKKQEATAKLSELYPDYYKPVSELTEIDVYAVHQLFVIQDPSGAIQHASKKLLLSGVRTGGKSKYEDIKEARDTLTRWLQLQEQLSLV